ncbi:uncharacterized protein ALTATR162_LOCUS1451 [Alternaria atra]|uniref:Ubiquitin-like protease family profile domain-containing protein n=1 Tax=Alternaria atra TaxID=119953 RepID=A0A8J2MXQ1_9PLEO|nr:uncharacterized protein ALTATR162_LOCUS1451 [Alternaria atra]CAG5143942.1 unnamed protein product [Alternaria atra]
MSKHNDQGAPAAGDTFGNMPPPAPPPPETREETINKWLRSRYIEHSHLGDPLVLSIEDFIDIVATSSTHPGKSWLEDNALGLAAALMTTSRTDILVVPSNAATKLASVGLCISDKNDFKTDVLSCQCYDAMKQESIRWVIVPVTNGMASPEEAARVKAARAEAAKAKKSRKAGQGDYSETGDQSMLDIIPGGGTHWGLMIIDKQRNDARWLDGHLTLGQKSNGKWCIKEILPPAWTAGKILCGYDKVMDLKRGQFTAVTLKHVPHDTHDNSYKGDKNSACGPWVIAMLEYLLKNPKFLTNGLHGAFRPRDKKYHHQRMAFNSLETRKRMQEIIRSVADENLGEDELPYKMTVRILKILDCLGTVDLLNGVLHFRYKKPPPRSGGDGGPTKGPDGGDDDEDDNDDEDDDNNAALQAILEQTFRVNKDASAQGFNDTSETGNQTVPDDLTMSSEDSNKATAGQPTIVGGVLGKPEVRGEKRKAEHGFPDYTQDGGKWPESGKRKKG